MSRRHHDDVQAMLISNACNGARGGLVGDLKWFSQSE
jgi:hypothetical protein